MLQVSQLFCYQAKSDWSDLRSMGSAELPRWEPEHAGCSLGRDGETWDYGIFGRLLILLRKTIKTEELTDKGYQGKKRNILKRNTDQWVLLLILKQRLWYKPPCILTEK